MSRAQRIVDMILGGERYANSKLFGDKVYVDEPILRTGARAYGKQETSVARQRQRRVSLPERYREVRRLARGRKKGVWGYPYVTDAAKLFVEQARLLADYEDDYPEEPDPYGYTGATPTYEDLSDNDLRCYVSWRTRLRAGEEVAAPGTFWRIYAFEIICGVGMEPGPVGLEALSRIGVDDPMLGVVRDQVKRWTHDYAIYYGIDSSLVSGIATSANIQAVSTLGRAERALLEPGGQVTWPERPQAGLPSSEELLDALITLSRYRADKSRFIRARREDVAWVACRVYADMVAHCAKRRKTGFVEGAFGPASRVSYTMFPGAMFWSETSHPDTTYELSSTERYVCARGFWWRELPCRRAEKSDEIGALLHAIDCRMRRATGDKHGLKDKPLPKYQGKFVDTRIAELLAMREAEEAARITIDRKALGSIRSAAARTREALLTDDEREETPQAISAMGGEAVVEQVFELRGVEPEGASSDGSRTVEEERSSSSAEELPLDDRQIELLRALLDGGALDGFDSLYVTLAVDDINEVFLDIVGDTVVEFDGEVPAIIEDYEQEVRDALG